MLPARLERLGCLSPDVFGRRRALRLRPRAVRAVRLQLFALAYNLANFMRRLALPEPVKHWSLTTLREKLTKLEAKVVRHARYIVFQMADVAVPQELLAALLRRIWQLSPAAT